MSDVGAVGFAEWRVVLEYVVTYSLFFRLLVLGDS